MLALDIHKLDLMSDTSTGQSHLIAETEDTK